MSFGLPVGDGKLSYGGYLRIPELLALQELRSDPGQHDETLFIVIHQVYELWFKQLLHEIDGVIARLARGEVLGATRLLRRCIEIQRVLVAQLSVLETMTPMDFLAFRDHIMPASGFQSVQFRELEFVSGLKDQRHLNGFGANPAERERLERRLREPGLGDVFDALLRARGFELPEPGDDAAGRTRLQSFMRLYREAEQHYDLFLLAEALIEYDEMFQLWRFRHVQMVERVIGGKPGTGGSDGAGYLRGTVDNRFFPELWAMRSHLSLGVAEEAGADTPKVRRVLGTDDDGEGPAPHGSGCPAGY
jgi:tryptophan 2,3-dioxygenase